MNNYDLNFLYNLFIFLENFNKFTIFLYISKMFLINYSLHSL